MLRSFSLSLMTALFLVATAAPGIGQNEMKPSKPDEPNLIGGWHAESILVLLKSGTRKNLGGPNGLCNVVISEDKFTLRVGDAVLSEMSCKIDPKQDPIAIDLKGKEGEMLGICKLNGDRLTIALNDAAKGRPKDFISKSLGLSMMLQRVEGSPLYIVDADGSNRRKFFAMPEYSHCRAPAWSPDGSKVAFVAMRTLFGERRENSRILVVDTEGKSPKELGIGVSPSWSPDGKRIAFTGVGAPGGVYTMNAEDGSDVEEIEANAQYASYSPKNDELAWIAEGNLWVYDMKTKKSAKLLDAQYLEIRWGFGWSPDGQWICFKGTNQDGKNQVALVHREGQKKGFRVLLPSENAADVKAWNCYFAWEPTQGKKILAALTTKQNGNYQLYLLDPEGKESPQPQPGQDAARSWSNGAWSPDGKRIVYCVYPANLELGILE